MAAFALFLASFVAISGVAGAALPQKISPVLFWSASDHFTGHLSVSKPLDASHVEGYVNDIVASPSQARMLHPSEISRKSPEIFLAFTFEKVPSKFMSTLIGSFGKSETIVKNLVKNAASSLTLSRVSLDYKYNSFASMFSIHFPTKSHRIEVEVGNGNDCESALAEISQRDQTFSNGKTDFINVVFTENDIRANELCLQRISKEIATKSKDSCVCMLAAEDVQPIMMEFPTVKKVPSRAKRHVRLHSVHIQSAATSSDSYVAGTGTIEYISPVIFIGILFALMLLGFLFVGILAMFSVVVPMRFEKSAFKLGKIY